MDMLFDFWLLVFWMLTWKSIIFQILYKQDTIHKNYNVEEKEKVLFKVSGNCNAFCTARRGTD